MSDFRDTPPSAGVPAARPAPRDEERVTRDDLFEHERIGIHNEAQTIRRDRIRWGPVWAGIVSAVGAYLFLQLALIAIGLVEVGDSARDDAIASGIAALLAFFIGGLVTGATSMWQGVDDGVIHGIVMWFAALVVIIAFSAVGSGLALGSFDTTDVFDDVTLEDVDVDAANDDAQEAAGWALLALTLGLMSAAAGGAVGAKLWPKDDAFVEVVRPKRAAERSDGRS